MKTDEKPLVSVILCFFNEEKFLEEAVNSVITQTYTRWELFLVDDGSSDRSPDIAKHFAAKYPAKIFYLDHPGHLNKGLSASRNAGIAKAKGEVVAFIDADDVWLPLKLERQLNILKKHPEVNVVLEASKYWRSWMSGQEKDVVIPVGVKEGTYTPPQLMVSLYPLGKGAAPCPSGIMVRKHVLHKCNFEESFRGIYQMYEDQAFLCKVYLNEVVYVSEAYHNLYRQRASSLVSAVHESGKYHTVRSHYLEWFKDYLQRQPKQYKEVTERLNHARMPYTRPVSHKLTVTFPLIIKKAIVRLFIRLGLLTYRKTW